MLSSCAIPKPRWLAALILFLAVCPVALSQPSNFISATGTVSGSGQSADFLFSTTIAGSPSTLTLRTWAFSGGTNFAGQTIAAGGIDSTLTLFNGSNASIAFNDDINSGSNLWDSQITQNNPANDSYRVHMASLNPGDGHWANDIGISAPPQVNTQLQLSGINLSSGATLNTLTIGAVFGTTTVRLSSGATINMTGAFTASNSTFTNFGGTLMAGSESFGGGSLGPVYVNQPGGANIIAGDLSTGPDGNNYGMIYALGGGTLQVGGNELLGTNSLAIASSFTQTAGYHSVGGLLSVGSGFSGTKYPSFNMNGGTLIAGQISVGHDVNGLMTQTGGFISTGLAYIGIGLSAAGTFNQSGGTFQASNTITVGGGSPSSWTIGSLATASTPWDVLIEDNSIVTLNGGTLSAGYFVFQGPGSTFIYNGGTLSLTNSNLDVGSAGLFGNIVTLSPSKVLSISGTTTIEANSTLQINSTTFSTGTLVNNGGQLVFPSGTIQITASPVQIGSAGSFGSTLQLSSGQNIIDTNVSFPSVVSSTGLLYLTGGTFSATAGITNSSGGEIQLTSTPSTLAGGILSNSGLVTGTGRIFNSLSNQSGGEVRVNSTDDLKFLGATNSNAGKINLFNGGIVEFPSGLTNSGLITGAGQFISNGTVTNSGTITLTGGNSDFQATLTQNSGGKVIVTGNSTSTFYNPVTNNAGSEFRVSTGATAVFLGSVTGTGSFSGQGVKIFENGGTLGPLATVVGSSVVSANSTLTVANVREASLEVDGNTVITPDGTANGVSKVNSLNIAGSTGAWIGKLDLKNNSMIIDYTGGSSPLTTVQDQIKTGRAGGSWNGNGITSSMADATHGLGVGDNTQLGFSTFGGQSVSSTSVLIKYTYLGDVNLDGQVDIKDLFALASHYNTSGDSWTTGDFNYDGVVNAQDLAYLARNWQAGVGSPLGAPLASIQGSLGLPSSSVPEAATGGVLVMPILLEFARKRRRSS